ncbi:MAG TPA: ABC transporter ATP-binding protein [Gemmataceae bacterium]|jgi:putative ABC transport system ATP-binding protein|nr:ABC transporter ATP-binding protein [Gemmataceae bacterium]
MRTRVTLQAFQLWKSFDNQVVLSDVSLTLNEGQVTLLMGPSGSGKSTLLAILAGLLHPDHGEVHFLGRDIWGGDFSDRDRDDLRRRHCGFIFQQCNLMPALTAEQQLRITLEWASDMPRNEIGQHVRETLVRLGLRDHLHSRPNELSGGEKQRVAVARAMAKRPRVIFADEPTAALDWEHNGRAVFEMLTRAAHEDGATVVIVSHDHRIADRSDRVLHIEDGHLTEA